MKKQNKWEEMFDQFLDLIELKLVKTKNGYFHLESYTNTNWGNIETEEFDNAGCILDSVSNYVDDYIVNSIIEHAEELDIPICYNDTNLYILEYRNKFPDENQWDFDIIDMICNHTQEINLENCTYEEEKDN